MDWEVRVGMTCYVSVLSDSVAVVLCLKGRCTKPAQTGVLRQAPYPHRYQSSGIDVILLYVAGNAHDAVLREAYFRFRAALVLRFSGILIKLL